MSFIQFSKNKIRQRRKIIRKLFVWFFLFALVLIGVSFLMKQNILDEVPHSAKEEFFINEEFEGEVYFNDRDGFEAYSQITRDAINSATQSIYVAMYSISDNEIIQLLDQKKREGIDVQIIIPKSKESQHAFTFALTDLQPITVGARSSNLETEDSQMNGELMHHKFIIIDPKSDNEQLLFGSSNLTYLQQKYDSSFLLATRDTLLISTFLDEFNLLLKNTHGLKKLRSGKFQPFSSNTIYKNGFIETWFGPGYRKNSLKQRMLELINTATDSIEIIGWRINDTDVYNALMKKARDGVPVKIIIDDYYMWDELSVSNTETVVENLEIFSDSYMDVLLSKNIFKNNDELKEDFNPFLHHHALIVDNETIIVGSNNWTQGGFFYNDESILVTDIPFFVSDYNDEFEYLSNLLIGKEYNFTLSNNTLIIPEELLMSKKVIFYIEKSNPDWVGEICFETTTTQQIEIPTECITKTTRIFITDEDYTIKASGYIK